MSKMVDPLIRPVFQRTHLDIRPKFLLAVKGAANGSPATYNIRPNPGQVWSLNYVQCLLAAMPYGTAAGHKMYIKLVDAITSTTVILEEDLSTVWGVDVISFGSFGNGPLYLTHDFYIEVYMTSDNAQSTSTYHVACSVTEV